MEPTVADNERTAINMKPDSNYSNSLGSELMSGEDLILSLNISYWKHKMQYHLLIW